MVSPIAGTGLQFRQGLWFGHFDPLRPFAPTDPRVARDLLSVLMRPLKTKDSLRSLFDLLGAVSPTFKEALQRPPGLQLGVSPDARGPFVEIPEEGAPSLWIPETNVLIADLREILLGVGRAVAPPDPFPPAPDVHRTPESEYQATYRFYEFRENAFGLSFLYQVAVDLSGQDLNILRPGTEGGFLTPSDILLFGVFRASGIRGLMEKMRQSSARGGALEVYPDPWGPLAEPGERPELPRTILDESLERITSWKTTPYRVETAAPKVSREEKQPLPKGREAETLVEMLRKWVPFGNPSLLEWIDSGRLDIRKVSGGVPGGGLRISFLQYFGLPDPTQMAIEFIPELCRIPRISALAWVIGQLASVAVPEEICRWFCRLDPGLEGDLAPRFVLEYLLYRHSCRASWACASLTAALSLTGARVPFRQKSVSTRLKEVLEKEGLAVLIERYWDLIDPAERKEMERRYSRYASVFCRAGGLPILIRYLRGEPVPQGELAVLAERANAFLEEEGKPEGGTVLRRLGASRGTGGDLAAAPLSQLRQRVEVVARLFDGLTKPIREREAEIAQSIRRLREFLDRIARGEIRPEVAELAERLKEADSLGVLLGPLVVEANRVRKETWDRQEGARKARVELRAAARAEVLRLEEERRSRESEAAKRRRAEEAAAAEQARKREDEERAAAESRRRAELEAKETTRRQGGRSVVESRRVYLEGVIREMEAIVLDLVDKGLFGLEIIDQEEIGLRDTKRTLRLPLWWRRRLGETIEAFETASQKPLSEERSAEPAVEAIRTLCDEVRREGALFQRILEGVV